MSCHKCHILVHLETKIAFTIVNTALKHIQKRVHFLSAGEAA